ncbi:nucleotidyltransferase domain-containing protein [Kineococcus gypseus]|uniref:nucleotidyltransferase domain-containing protein n=1 Tax=Kineococcus gypseus TaxID=1637102 RepID=UPI003D7EBF8B
MSARLKGRRRQVQRLLSDLTGWAQRTDVHAAVLVGSYARGHERMASDVDVVLLLPDAQAHHAASGWFAQLRPGARLVRSALWGPVREQRYRLRCGLLVEIGLAPLNWADVPLDPGTRRVLADGHRILHDPYGTLSRAAEALRPL